MKIYFAGSIRGGQDDQDLYFKIIDKLKEYGQVLTEHIGNNNLTNTDKNNKNSQFIYTRDVNWIKEADVIVAEVSTPSLGVGYEIGFSENTKPILCLYRENSEKRLSAMIDGNKNLVVKRYNNINDASELIDSFFKTL